MTQKIAALCLGFSILVTTARLAAQVSIRRPAQASQTERINFAPGGTIRLNDSFGDLYVDGWDQPFVEMTLIKEMHNYDAPADVKERLDKVRFTTEHSSASELIISTSIPSRSFFRHPLGGHGAVTVRYEIHLPRDSRLAIRHGGGNILISNVTGGVEASNRNGDIVLMLPGPGPYSVDAKTRIGTVTSDFAGKAHVRYFVGESFTGPGSNAAHSIRLRVRVGGITIKEMPPEAQP